MASKSSSNDEPTAQETDSPPPEETPPEETKPEDAPPADESEGGEQPVIELPPTLKEAGLNGVVAMTSGQYSTQSGASFYLSPGQAYAMSPEDAQDLIDQGVAKALDDTSAPS